LASLSDPIYTEAVAYRLRDVERRLSNIEALKPDVMADRIDNMAKEFRTMKNAFYLLIVAIIGATLAFAFTVISLKP
jgi:hypothetical protein